PDHPGLAHYIIHTYDVPSLAGKALVAARRYSDIAPDAPHALHMPSHTFTRVGYWQNSIDSNRAAAAASRRVGQTAEELHASDYQVYAYLQTAQDEAARKDIRTRLEKAKESYWAGQAEIQGLEVNAWSSLAEGRKDLALTMMKSAAEMEDGTDKKAITPGPLVPARELLGEMLLEINQPAQALQQFEATLKKEPNRFRALHGAARAAQLSGNREASRKYFAELLKICERADKPGRAEVLEANKAVLGN